MSEKIKVATYNVGDYTGIDIKHGSEESREAFRAVFEKIGADLWALQEDVEFFNTETKETAFDAFYSSIHKNYKRNYTGNYNGKAFLTSLPLTDVEPIKYTGSMKFRHPWYLTGKVTVGEKADHPYLPPLRLVRSGGQSRGDPSDAAFCQGAGILYHYGRL